VLRSTEQTVDGQWKLDEPARRKLTANEKKAAILSIGDLLVTKSSGSSLHIGKTTLVDEYVASLSCCYSNFMQRIRLNDALLPKLAWYVMNNVLARLQFDLLSNSTTGLANLNGTMIGEILLPVASAEEQIAIAVFLDRETGKIDALIAEQKKLITLLAEKRQATISHAVTRGLNPHAAMKDSGVAWLGEVPSHWDVVTFQRCVCVAEGQVNPEEYPYRTMPLIAPNHVESGTGRLLYVETAEQQSAESGKYFCNAGDVIYSKIRPALRKVCIAPEDCLCSADMYPLRGTSRLSNPFLMWFMLSEPFSALAVLESERVAMPKINRESLKDVWLALPTIEEQSAIVDFLDTETNKLDALKTEAERGIALLKERRSALIAAAVTGQVDVRGEVPQQVAPMEGLAA
jgi:type I restriction enzyme S subunit